MVEAGLTCAEQQQDLHAQILVVGNLQPDELAGDLQHLLALVGHVGQLHPLPVGITQKQLKQRSSFKLIYKCCWCRLNQGDEAAPCNISSVD